MKNTLIKMGFASKEYDPQVVQDIPDLLDSLSPNDKRWMQIESDYYAKTYNLQLQMCSKRLQEKLDQELQMQTLQKRLWNQKK